MRILVTGGAGFIGSVLCERLLEQNHEVHCLDNFSNSGQNSISGLLHNPNFSFEKYDVSNYYLTKSFNYDAIVHLAGLVGFPKCANNQTLSRIWNIDSTSSMIALARKVKCKFLYASTGSVYGKIDNICTEESKTNPVSTYGLHKLEAEQLVRDYDGSISLRFATGFGVSRSPRFDLLPNTFVFNAIKDGLLAIFQKDARRTFISVEEMANSFIFALNNYDNSNHQVYNVGNESLNMTKYDLAESIKKYLSFKTIYTDGVDPDQRDYEVSYQRLREFGHEVKNDMDIQIQKLIKCWRLYV